MSTKGVSFSVISLPPKKKEKTKWLWMKINSENKGRQDISDQNHSGYYYAPKWQTEIDGKACHGKGTKRYQVKMVNEIPNSFLD